MKADEIARKWTSGTTTDASEIKVLWIGRKYALAKWPGGGIYRFGHTDWVPGEISLLEIGKISIMSGTKWWSCDTKKDWSPGLFGKGRATKKVVAMLIAEAEKLEEHELGKETFAKWLVDFLAWFKDNGDAETVFIYGTDDPKDPHGYEKLAKMFAMERFNK